MNFAEGATWNEASTGTNAIGTAIAAEHAVQVFAAEHFNEAAQAWTCAGAPIHDPDSEELLGVINISNQMATAHPHNFACAVATAQAVEAHLRCGMHERDARLRSRHGELLARSGCSVVGIDQSSEMLAAARARFAGSGADVELLEGQAEALPFPDGSFDALTVTYLLRYVEDPPATMRELARVVRPGGRVASLEFGVPPRPAARQAWRLYTAVGLPTLGRLASREWVEVGHFLGPSIRDFYERHPLERIVGYWRAAGLEDVRVRRMSLGGGIVMSARRA